jgi:hypothetical protein
MNETAFRIHGKYEYSFVLELFGNFSESEISNRALNYLLKFSEK